MAGPLSAHHLPGVPLGRAFRPERDPVAGLRRHARMRPGAPFLTAIAADGTSTTLSYHEADTRSRALAARLRDEHRLEPGAVVGLIPRNDIASVVAILALLRAGHPALMLSPADPPARLRPQIDALHAAPVLRSPAVEAPAGLDTVALPERGALTEPGAQPGPAAAEPVPRAADDAFFFSTSGSTAAAKLVAQSRLNVVANAAAVGDHHGLTPDDRVLGCLPLHHVNGLHFTVLAVAAAGAHLVLAPAFDPFGYPALLERFRPRLASVVPSVLEGLLSTFRGRAVPPGFEYFVSAAAPLAVTTARQVRQRLGVPVVQGYGLTETTNFSTTMPPGLDPETYGRLMLDTDIPSVGVAVPGNEVAVLRPDGSRAGPGETGEVCMRGLNVMSRYAGNPDATAEALHGGWFHSQDLGYAVRDERDGREFFILTGRLKNIAKVGGESVSLEEMERALRAAPGVRDAACATVAHRLTGEEIVAAVVVDGDRPPDLRTHLGAAFAPAVIPRRITVVAAIPRTATGKILRPQLAALLA